MEIISRDLAGKWVAWDREQTKIIALPIPSMRQNNLLQILDGERSLLAKYRPPVTGHITAVV